MAILGTGDLGLADHPAAEPVDHIWKLSLRLIPILAVAITLVTFVVARNQVRTEKRGLQADLERRRYGVFELLASDVGIQRMRLSAAMCDDGIVQPENPPDLRNASSSAVVVRPSTALRCGKRLKRRMMSAWVRA